MRVDSSTVPIWLLGLTTVAIARMLESTVDAPKEPSDLKEALPLVDVWRSATMQSGAQCVMTCGAEVMQ